MTGWFRRLIRVLRLPAEIRRRVSYCVQFHCEDGDTPEVIKGARTALVDLSDWIEGEDYTYSFLDEWPQHAFSHLADIGFPCYYMQIMPDRSVQKMQGTLIGRLDSKPVGGYCTSVRRVLLDDGRVIEITFPPGMYPQVTYKEIDNRGGLTFDS